MKEPALTRAELEVAESLGEGRTCLGTADWLGIKKKTVYAHVENIAEKLTSAGLNPHKMKPYQLVSRWAFMRQQAKRRGAA